MQHAVADEAVLDALDLLVDVALPQQHCRDDVAVAQLQQVLDGQHPLVLLSLREFQLLADLNVHTLQRVIVGDLDLELHRNFSLSVLRHDLFYYEATRVQNIQPKINLPQYHSIPMKMN